MSDHTKESLMRRYPLLILIIIALVMPAVAAQAQDDLFPLPAPLYLLTSDHVILRVDPMSGAQTQISPDGQMVADFDIAPDGAWYTYRTVGEGVVIIADLNSNSGYVLEFGENPPPPSSHHL